VDVLPLVDVAHLADVLLLPVAHVLPPVPPPGLNKEDRCMVLFLLCLLLMKGYPSCKEDDMDSYIQSTVGVTKSHQLTK
jgi:hypothetical protein